MSGDLLIVGIGELATSRGKTARRGDAMRDITRIPDAAIVARDGVIAYVGPRTGLRSEMVEGLEAFDARGATAMPGFVDSHSHFASSGYRADEFLARVRGAGDEGIHDAGGGVLRSVEATRGTDLYELTRLTEARAWTMVQQGVTTVESKSGYGLDLETELRQLEVSIKASEQAPIDIVPTYLGLRATPPEFEGKAERYVDYAIAEVLPAVAAQGRARFCDALCEAGAFSVSDCRRFLAAAKALGLGVKIHAEGFERSGGAALAAELGAASADLLIAANEEDFRLLSAAGVVATCLPLTSFCLKRPHANARAMIDSGLAVALATDFDPGSSCSGSIPLAIALAVLSMGLSIEETLTALTLNGAAALGLAEDRGSLEEGKLCDFVLLDAPSVDHLPYRTGVNLVTATFKGGELVYRA
jgi:imidazolonepropionase